MANKNLNVPVEETLLEYFKTKCKDLDIPLKDAIELLIKGYNEDVYTFEVEVKRSYTLPTKTKKTKSE